MTTKPSNVYRIYAPFHAPHSSGTFEFGIFNSLKMGRLHLRDMADYVARNCGAEIEWRCDDEFVAIRHEIGMDQDIRVHYRLMAYPVNTPLTEQFAGFPAVERSLAI